MKTIFFKNFYGCLYYEYSNDNKTIKKRLTDKQRRIFCERDVKFDNTTKEISFKINTLLSAITFGFGLTNPNSYIYDNSKMKCGKQFNSDSNNIELVSNDIITMCFDTFNNKLFFKKNSKLWSDSQTVIVCDESKKEFKPFIMLEKEGDSVTIV